MVLFLIVFTLIVLEAIHEGLKQRGLSLIAGIVEAVKLTEIALMIPFLLWYSPEYADYFSQPWKFWQIFLPLYIIGGASLRLGIFDYVYNVAAGNPVLYIGNTKWSDKKIMQPVFRFMGPYMYVWFKIVILILGIGLLFKI